jgi:hypothetical protein
MRDYFYIFLRAFCFYAFYAAIKTTSHRPAKHVRAGGHCELG